MVSGGGHFIDAPRAPAFPTGFIFASAPRILEAQPPLPFFENNA
jgi:hypothetical protein